MVTKPRDLRELIESDIIKSASDEVCKRTHSVVYPVYNDTLFEATRNQLDKAGISVEDLYEVLSAHRIRFVNYACASVLDSRGSSIEQEYPPSEKPGEEDSWVVRKELGVARDFIIPHLIDYWFLINNPDGFEAYLKSTRTPNARNQAKKLTQLLDSVTTKGNRSI